MNELVNPSTDPDFQSADAPQLIRDREIQRLQLELAEREKTIRRLSDELERNRLATSEQARELAQAHVEGVLSQVGLPAVTLLTQAYLLEQEGKPIQARDVLTVAKKLIHAFELMGLSFVGSVGEVVSYDPNYHLASSANAQIQPGEKVKIQFVGVQYQGKILRKASVEKEGAR